jgi:hypothetical protein
MINRTKIYFWLGIFTGYSIGLVVALIIMRLR